MCTRVIDEESFLDLVSSYCSTDEKILFSPAGTFPGNQLLLLFSRRSSSESVASAFLTQGQRSRASGVGNDSARTQTARDTFTVAVLSARGPCGSLVVLRGVSIPVFKRTVAALLVPRPIDRITTGPTIARFGTLLRIEEGMGLEKVEMVPVCTDSLKILVEFFGFAVPFRCGNIRPLSLD